MILLGATMDKAGIKTRDIQFFSYDIALVQRLLQHSSAAVTQRYIGIGPKRIEAAIETHVQLL